MGVSIISAAHAFDYKVHRVKFSLTSCEELATPLQTYYVRNSCLSLSVNLYNGKSLAPFTLGQQYIAGYRISCNNSNTLSRALATRGNLQITVPAVKLTIFKEKTEETS